MTMKDGITLRTDSGLVHGHSKGGYQIFLGIPYARAKRFQPPKSCSWGGVLEADSPGPRAWQASSEDCGEDCLNLNVFVPENIKKAEGLPVVVDIHGGAFQAGSNREQLTTGKGMLLGKPFIYVAINYRLGVWGYLQLGKLLGEKYRFSGNCGLLDQIAALRWVGRNIEGFGGNPKKITVMGFSAGAKSAVALMVSLGAEKLFQRAILSSGGLVPTYLVVEKLNLLNTMWALILPTAVGMYNIIVMRTYFQSRIPIEMEEAAKVDGCTNFRLLLQIVLPLSVPIIAVIALYYGVGHWNAFFNAMIYMTDEKKYPLQLVLRFILLQNQATNMMEIATDAGYSDSMMRRMGLKYAVIVISTIPIFVIYPLIQKFFSKGVMIGAVKG